MLTLTLSVVYFQGGDFYVKYFIDMFIGVTFLVLLFIPMVLIATVVRLTSKGPSLYWSDRVGKNNAIFKMPKFRTMNI